jgi:hypothetical protein
MGDNPTDEHCYVALCPQCDGWQAVSVICKETDKGMGRDLSQWHRWGLIIERWTVERFSKEAVSCKCLKQKKAKQGELGL